MYPPPPIPFIHGSTTPAVKAVLTAASTAFPPRRRTSAPTAAACGVLAATIPPRPRASSRLTCHSVSTGIARPSPRVARLSPADHRRPALRTELRKGLDNGARRVYVHYVARGGEQSLKRAAADADEARAQARNLSAFCCVPHRQGAGDRRPRGPLMSGQRWRTSRHF